MYSLINKNQINWIYVFHNAYFFPVHVCQADSFFGAISIEADIFSATQA